MYNGNGTMALQKYYEWISLPLVGTLPFIQWKYTYTYTGDILTSVYHEVSYTGSTTLTPKDVANYTLDINDHYYSLVQQTYDTTAQSFVNTRKYFFDYDTDGDLLHEVSQDWNGAAWISNKEDYYWYNTALTGVDEIAEIKSLNVFPNPFNQTAVVEFNLNKSNEATVGVFDLNGRLVSEIKQFFTEGTNRWMLDGSELNAGLYFVRIETVNEKFVQKITKM